MKQMFLFLVVICCPSAFAQNEFLNKSNSIAPNGSGLNMSVAKPSSTFTPNTKSTSSNSTIEKKDLQFAQSNDFANPGDIYKDKLNKREGGDNYKAFRKNEYLGDFKTKSAYLTIGCRDFGQVDGDEIRISINGRIIIDRIVLDNEFKGLQLALAMGFNKIDFEALNEGQLSPNTGEFETFDDKHQIITANQWSLSTGFKGSIIVIRE